MIEPMTRTHIRHYTFIEAANTWQRPIMDVVQMAANGVFTAYVVAEDGWAELDAKDLLKSLNRDSVVVQKIKYQNRFETLTNPAEYYWGAVYVDSATLKRFETEAGQEASIKADKLDRLLNAKDVAKLLGIQPDTLTKWRQQGKGPRHQKLGGTVKYSEKEVQDYLKSLKNQP